MVDTAGIKRKKLNMERLEFFGFTRARTAIADSDVCILVIDALDGITEGDKRIADNILDSRKGLVIAVNKMDLVEKPKYNLFLDAMYADAPFLRARPCFLFPPSNGPMWTRRCKRFAMCAAASTSSFRSSY